MAKKRQSASAHLEVLRELYEFIDREYAGGGLLPPSRVMCSRMGVSRATYNKAVARLISEGVASSNRKGGTRINPVHQRIHKVGIVLRYAEDCPFVGRETSVTEAFTCLFEHAYHVQIIHASPMKNVGRQALLHNINALLWFFPRASALPTIRGLRDSRFSLMLVSPEDPASEGDAVLTDEAPHVIADPQQGWVAIASFLKRRAKPRRVLYLGHPWWARRSGLCRRLQRAGHRFSESDCIGKTSFEPAWMTRLIERTDIDTVITEGNGARQELLFKALCALPRERPQPEVIARDAGNTSTLGRMYPRVRLTGILDSDGEAIGREAATIMARHLTKKTPLRSRAIAAYSVQRV